ncbi:uncharacterized protein LOC133198627 isoform X2 [Saccostrea echinata]|uniref:uncharacterized protein LOC133198627 isoform X2 n=1 Tax=Saccostrea echinata TaxID=191078 RepID=UPI002A7FFCFA|nr:uncharacterized protein LOC133198627 isoform X2 [Saccostrea echinata]
MCSRVFLNEKQMGFCVCLFVFLVTFVVSSTEVSRPNLTRQFNSKFNRLKRFSTKYRFPVNEMDSCPTTNFSWYRAGSRLNCSHDANKRLQYLCIPNQEKTALIEFCYDHIMGLFEKGYCLHLSTSGFVNQEDCSMFNKGCPGTHFFSSNIFQFPKCLEINRDLRCFMADQSCHAISNYSASKPNNLVCDDTSGNCIYTTLMPKPAPKDESYLGF